MDRTVKARLQTDSVSFTAADADLLRAIARNNSVIGATDELGRSRSHALTRIETLEDAFGDLVSRQRGGQAGGGSELTARAQDILATFTRMQATLAGTANTEECVIHGTMVNHRGQLCTVDTDAGTVRARFGNHLDESVSIPRQMQVSVRSDTVTLHDPANVPNVDSTSARNQFKGPIVEIDEGSSINRVTVDIGTEDALIALLTDESLNRLTIEVGNPIAASFKATATRALPI